MEFGGSLGLVNYLGDYNSSILGAQQPMASLLVRRVINPYMTLRADLSYGKLKYDFEEKNNYYPLTPSNSPTGGGQNLTEENPTDGLNPSPVGRQGGVSDLIDLSMVYEYNFWAYGTGRDYFRAKRLAPYIFLGLGLTYAKPDNANSAFTAHLPLGAGVKYKIADRLNLGLEWRVHFSMSDRLDGVVDPYGIPSQGSFKNADGYSMLKLTLTYSMLAKCSTCNPSY
ncbi:MAG: porin family protein [Bacteroidaceae bacterium]|nr:porin family protein [Bacteroidaceae bacterium]